MITALCLLIGGWCVWRTLRAIPRNEDQTTPEQLGLVLAQHKQNARR